jgi:hypothetical protein
VNYGGEIFAEVRMSCVKADSDFTRVEGAENPQQIPGPAGEQMREHVFQHKSDAQPAAVEGRLVQNPNRILKTPEALVIRQSCVFGSWMNDEIADLENRGRLRGLQQLLESKVANVPVRRSDVNSV